MKNSTLIGAACGLCMAFPNCGRAQTAGAEYFVPPTPPAQTLNTPPGMLAQAWPAGTGDPVVEDHRMIGDGHDAAGTPWQAGPAETAWYESDLGVLGIGLAATGIAFAFDHGANQFVYTKLNYGARKNALHGADVLELAPVAFAAVTWFQSPLADPELAHASSIALTSMVAVTIESTALKFAVGRQWSKRPDSNPFVFQPFDASASTLNVPAVALGNGHISAFPSGNTAVAFAAVTPYAEIYHQPWLYAIPVAVGLGRLAAPNPQWASDVVAGGLLGWLTADLTRRLFPHSDYGLMLFDDGHTMTVGISGRF
jgi:membrane-associated phospholipid phosphatase